jgi:glucosamine 6-phosphate synthetase-like amidotransferase/phosphosugar isomerase protein
MLRDIRSQGDALAEGLVSMRRQLDTDGDLRTRRVILTGSGDSYIAGCALRHVFEARGEHVAVEPSLDVARFLGLTPDDLVVVVSVSGEVARTIEACRAATSTHATTVAITADPTSTLARSAHMTVTIPPPIDRSIPHSRDYSVTLLALACVLEAWAGERIEGLDRVPAAVAAAVPRAFDEIAAVAPTDGRTWFLGAGPDRGTAMFGALKFWEAAGLEAWWDDLEEFAHGSQLMARPGDRAVLIAAGPASSRAVEMVDGLERMGLEVILVGDGSVATKDRTHLWTGDDLPFELHPFVSCIPLQALTYVEAEARGLDVSVPLFGKSHGPVYDEVHAEWTRRSEIVTDRHIR